MLPLFERATDIAIVAAFVQGAGLDRIEQALRRALARGARVRVLTGDYLTFTQPSALDELLALERECAAEDDEIERLPGSLQTRVIETGRIDGPVRSFHPKSWRFQSDSFGIACVGSSNLTHTALEGMECNLRVDRDRDPSAYARVEAAFDDIWQLARPIDEAWLATYTDRWKRARTQAVPGEAECDVLAAPPEPHPAQQEALAALAAARQEGRTRAIVVLGKTWLAAFDYAALHAELGRVPRLLFLAHRRELLHQAARTYRRQLTALGSDARVGWFVADKDMLSADLVFASVSKLARKDALARLRAESFDYVVVDEVHHSAADSYRRVLGALDPLFLLGLTATPDRADSADILGLFDDFVAYRADIMRGIALRRLTPFRYFGVKDDIDYANIPWRNRRFDPEELTRAAQTEARMATLWRAWKEHPGTRTLVFCCSIAHAVFVRSWLRDRGARVAAVFVADGSDDRDTALRDLDAGALDTVIAVDVFNEGVDVPSVDRVVMLRPTESGVVFLQQLGRGLRVSEGKEQVTVIDFVGNHRIFLDRLRTLLSLGDRGTVSRVRELLASAGPMDLPEGCSVELAIEAKELLQKLFRPGGTDEVERAYRDLALERGAKEDSSQRPTAGEMQRMSYRPSLLRERHGSWLEFVRGEGHLTESEARAVELAGPFLRDLESTEMTKCFKMVALQALLDEDALTSGLPLDALARRSHAILRRSPELFSDLAGDVRLTTLDADGLRRFVAYWRKNPIAAWTGGKAAGRTYFRVDGDRFRLDLRVDPSLSEILARLVGELVDYRLAQYRDRKRELAAASDGFVCKVLSNKRDPILKLPPRTGTTLPEGETDVRVPNGSVWQFRFAKEFCNVARPAGRPSNQLPDLLREWFGPRAGQPGTSFQVRFKASPDGLWAAPVEGQLVALGTRRGVVAYPDLRAAAGHALEAAEAPDAERVWLPLTDASSELFAVRVSGRSMEGGKVPLHDGDWAVFRFARGAPASALENRVVLAETHRAGPGAQYQIKRLTPAGTGWRFVSDNPEGPSFDASDETVAIARLERALRPEELAPPEGSTLAQADFASSFGLDELNPRTGRHGGHLFVFIDQRDILVAPDRVRHPGNPGSSETAFVLARRVRDAVGSDARAPVSRARG
ncbi:MAG: DEAD/DEAH box helicase family protein [Polyangiaceae bacterium]|nr:DEAD/DEAH box helicase family protein [Polyangiaceae bacterium]